MIRNALGTLAVLGLGGLALIAAGVLPWGIRAVALFTLLGFIWIFGLVMTLTVDLYQKINGGS